MKKIRWGVLGFARIAKNEGIPAILESGNGMLYAVASRSEEKLQEARTLFTPCMLYSDYETLLEDEDIDAVYIPLPNALHREWAIKAMKKGKHVLCEKPLALHEKEVLEMAEAAEENGVLLMEGFMYRYTRRMEKVLEILESGILGEIRHVDSSFRFLLNRENTIKMKKELGGGALYDVGCYPVSFISLILGEEPQEIRVLTEEKDQVDVQISALLKYRGGKMAALHAGFNAFGRNHSEIIGTKGRLEIPDTFLDVEGSLLLYTEKGREEIPVEGCHRYTLEFEDFARAILEGGEPLVTLKESLRTSRIMDRIFEAMGK